MRPLFLFRFAKRRIGQLADGFALQCLEEVHRILLGSDLRYIGSNNERNGNRKDSQSLGEVSSVRHCLLNPFGS